MRPISVQFCFKVGKFKEPKTYRNSTHREDRKKPTNDYKLHMLFVQIVT